MYKAYGFPSLDDLLSYPLGTEPKDSAGFPVVEESIILMGKTLLGTTRTYSQAVALCRAWRLNKPTRRTLVDISRR